MDLSEFTKEAVSMAWYNKMIGRGIKRRKPMLKSLVQSNTRKGRDLATSLGTKTQNQAARIMKSRPYRYALSRSITSGAITPSVKKLI